MPKLEAHIALLEAAASHPGVLEGEKSFLELYGLTGGAARLDEFVEPRGWTPKLHGAILAARMDNFTRTRPRAARRARSRT